MDDPKRSGALIVTAADYGSSPRYDRGILEAASAGALDAVSAMVGEGPVAVAVAAIAAERGLIVRSIDERHRRALRRHGIAPPTSWSAG